MISKTEINKAKKKFLAVFFALIIVIQILPLSIVVFADEAVSVESFSELSDAISGGKSNIEISADIIFSEAITVPEGVSINIKGGNKLISASFKGSGSVTLDVAASSLEVGGNVKLIANKSISSVENYTALIVSDNSEVTVNAEITASNSATGVEVVGSAKVNINASVKGGNSNLNGGAGVILSSGTLKVTGNITGGTGDSEGGIGVKLIRGSFTINGNIAGGLSGNGKGGVGLLYTGTNANEISTSVIGNITGGTGNIGGAGISVATNRFSLSVNGAVSGGTGTTSGGNGIELFYGSQILTATSVKGGTGASGNGADFFDKTSSDIFGDFSDNTFINLPTYNGSLIRLVSGKKSNNSLRNIVFNAYDFSISGKFSAGSTFKLLKSPKEDGVKWSLADSESIFETYSFEFTSATIDAIFKNTELSDKQVKILSYLNGEVKTVWSGKFTNDGVSLKNLENNAVYAIVVEKGETTYKVNVTVGQNGKVDPSGEVIVKENGEFKFTITPDEGYVVDKLIVNNVEQDGPIKTNYSIKDINKDINISVSFKKTSIVKVNLDVSAGAGGKISPSGTVVVDSGSSKTFIVSPDAGYIIDKFTINGTEVEARNNTFTLSNITTETTIRVTFKQTDEQVKVTISSTAGGSVSPSGEQKIPYGGNLTIKITPDVGYIINRLMIDGQNVQANNNEYVLNNITTDKVVDVSFVLDNSIDAMIKVGDIDWSSSPLRISLSDFTRVSAEVIAEIVESYPSKEVIFYSDKYEISFSPLTLSKISDNYIDFGLIIDNSTNMGALSDIAEGKYLKVFSFANSISFLPAEAKVKIYLGNQYIGHDVTLYILDSSTQQFKLQEEITVDANGYATIKASTPTEFALVTELIDQMYTIEAIAGENGSVSPSGEQQYKQGSTAIFTFSPDYGFEIDKFLIDGVDIELSGNSYTFDSVDGNHVIEVTFKATDDESNPVIKKKASTGMVVFIIFLVIVLLCAVAFVVLYKLGIIKLKNFKFFN